jgi:OmpA-OmpF porin, OOP family
MPSLSFRGRGDTSLAFDTGGAALQGHDQDTVRGVASSMKSNPGLNATIIGKADTVGSPEFNEKLRKRRAVAVYDALVHDSNIAENRVQMRWTGEQVPYTLKEDQKPELLNRLVEIVVQ